MRALLAVALVALPLTGLALLATGSSPPAAASRDAILHLTPGPDEAQAVRSMAGTDARARGTAGARAGLLAVLLGGTTLAVLRSSTPVRVPAVHPVRTGRGVPTPGRGPPLLAD